MVKTYCAGDRGLEAAEPLVPHSEEVTRKTLGVPLFQEQAMQIAVVGAGLHGQRGRSSAVGRLPLSPAHGHNATTHRDRFVQGMMRTDTVRTLPKAWFCPESRALRLWASPKAMRRLLRCSRYVSSWFGMPPSASCMCRLLKCTAMGFTPRPDRTHAREHGKLNCAPGLREPLAHGDTTSLVAFAQTGPWRCGSGFVRSRLCAKVMRLGS